MSRESGWIRRQVGKLRALISLKIQTIDCYVEVRENIFKKCSSFFCVFRKMTRRSGFTGLNNSKKLNSDSKKKILAIFKH